VNEHAIDPPRDTAWRPRLGAIPDAAGARFRVWAPAPSRVELVLDPRGPSPRRHPMTPEDGGWYTAEVEGLADGEGPFPDPCSRFQPHGVHGPSAVVDPSRFAWSDEAWRGLLPGDAIVYELHVGTFSPAGTFAGVIERLPYLADLGVTVVELMPVADFPGSHNWGYDGVSLYAPSRRYGEPDDLRRLVDTAHGLGLAVLVDAVYNHLGPDGAYHALFSPFYRSTRHESPWGPAVNLDGERAADVRTFLIENALHWLHEYHADGLRLDATHWLMDDSRPHFLAELSERARASVTGRQLLLIAEDERNLAEMIRPPAEQGWGLDAVWADDFHHQVRRLAAGDRDGYYQDYSGSLADLATTLRQGWFYTGQHSAYGGGPRGTDPSGLPLERMVICIQNHDQIGNRPFGRRLNHQIEPSLFRALSALLLFAPETPLLFMGQEWAASTPFLYFTDHHPELGRLVTEGRRAEFARFEAFADETKRVRIPDPQARSTYDASRLRWDERAQTPHAGTLELYRALLRLRRAEGALHRRTPVDVVHVEHLGLAIRRAGDGGDDLLLVACLLGPGLYDRSTGASMAEGSDWTVALTTEELRFRERASRQAATSPEVETEGGLAIRFHRPSAVILRRRRAST
jgi:maltooligosyltrehalose trehalohydrolase